MTGPIRLAFVLPHLRPGGAERVVVNLLRGLDRTRFEPLLLLARKEGAFLDLLPCDVPLVDLDGKRARQLPWRIARELRSLEAHAAYSATNAMNLALLAAPRWRRHAVRITSEHSNPAEQLAEAKRPRLRLLAMRLLAHRADRIAVPTDMIAAELKGLLGRPMLPTVTLPNPVIDELPPPVPRPRSSRIRIVAAGRLVEVKGFDLLIEAVAQLGERGLDCELAIHGEGPLEDSLAGLIEARGLSGRVRLPGHATDLRTAFLAADLCVVPSRREGFGNVIVEAMAAGLPVLATACSGPRSLIDHGRNGFLVHPDDPQALADALEELVVQPARRTSVIEEGRRTASRFEVRSATERFEEMVEAAVRQGSGRDRPAPEQPDN